MWIIRNVMAGRHCVISTATEIYLFSLMTLLLRNFLTDDGTPEKVLDIVKPPLIVNIRHFTVQLYQSLWYNEEVLDN